MNKENLKSYLLISFVVVELLSMMFNFYFVPITFGGATYHFNFSIVFFCLGFFIVDIVADYYSPAQANKFVFYKLFSQTLFIVLGNIAISVYDLQGTQLAQVLSKSPWVIAAGLLATCAGFYVMGHIMSTLKFGIYQGTSTFKRYLYSTLPGELLFSLIFTFLCFYQFNSIEELTDIFIASAAAKVILSTIFASIISMLFRLLQIKQEQAPLPRTLQIN